MSQSIQNKIKLFYDYLEKRIQKKEDERATYNATSDARALLKTEIAELNVIIDFFKSMFMESEGNSLTKFTPQSDQLKETLEHIYYEMNQLIYTSTRSGSGALKNALLESRLIHVRTLLDFFQKQRRSMMKGNELDDVLCSDYGFTSQPVAINTNYQERLNKDLVHLTYSRSNRLPKDKPWPYDEVVAPILECSRQFGEHLISSYLPANYPEKIKDWQGLVNAIKAIG